VEKFIQANTQELAKDKWLCPLSGKKFRGPDFIRKHIENKHVDKLDEVKKDVAFFNNYVKDPKRPALPEHPSSVVVAPPAPAGGAAGLVGAGGVNPAVAAALAANPALVMAVAAGLRGGPGGGGPPDMRG
jgi:hypothetical protein